MLGVIMLDTVFPRFPGDIGNPSTFEFPVIYQVVSGAIPRRVVYDADRDLLKPFIQAAKQLEKQGAKAISTSCGFLSLFQSQIAAEIQVPFISSSLLQVPLVYSMFCSGRKVGIMTANARHLTAEHFQEVGAGNIPMVIQGMEDQAEFTKVFLNNSRDADFNRLKTEVASVAARFAGSKEVGALVLECTNLPPFDRQIRKAAGLPVFHLNSLINMVYRSL